MLLIESTVMILRHFKFNEHKTSTRVTISVPSSKGINALRIGEVDMCQRNGILLADEEALEVQIWCPEIPITTNCDMCLELYI